MSTQVQDPDEKRSISHIPYSASYNDLVQAWLAVFSEDSYCLVIYDPQTHIEYLLNTGLSIDRSDTYDSKVLLIEVKDIDDAIWLCNNIPHETGPYVQVWAKCELLTDNIEK
jgi:hypothetical protein